MDVRTELHDALDEQGFPSDALLHRAMAQLDRPAVKRPRNIVPASIATGLIAAALVVTLVAVNLMSAVQEGPAMTTASSINGLAGYHFASPTEGWIHLRQSVDIVAHTSDGGKTWHQQLSVPGLRSAADMEWMDPRNGVLMGEKGNVAVVWRTDDGGNHWKEYSVQVSSQAPPGNWVFQSGDFLDANHGWMLFGRNFPPGGNFPPGCRGCGLLPNDLLLYTTNDGGGHWVEAADIRNVQSNLVPRFTTPLRGILQPPVARSAVYVTDDGGSTWTVHMLPAVPLALPCPPHVDRGPSPCERLYNAGVVTFQSPSEGFVVERLLTPGSSCGGRVCPIDPTQTGRFLFETRDGGATWLFIATLPSSLGSVAWLDHLRGVDVGVNGVNVTSDGGSVWSLVGVAPLPAGWYVSRTDFTDARHGWATLADDWVQAEIAADRGTGAEGTNVQFRMLATSDGGVTWRDVKLPTAA